MNIFSQIKSGFTGIKEKFYLGSSLVIGGEVPQASEFDYLQSFQASSLVHTATSKIAERMSMIELELYQLQGGTAKMLEQHEALYLLARPNPVMSGNDLLQITAVYQTLVGNAFWYLARNGSGKVIEIWSMRPDFVHVVSNADGSNGTQNFSISPHVLTLF